MNTKSKARIISRAVREVLARNDGAKTAAFQNLVEMVGASNTSKLLDLKISSKINVSPLSICQRRLLLKSSSAIKKSSGKVCVKVFGRYVPLFIY